MKTLDWKSVSGERSRTYIFPHGGQFTVKDVVKICVRPSGSHRLETKDGKKYIVASKWVAIEVECSEWSF